MKYSLLLLFTSILISCSATSKLENPRNYEGKVSLSAKNISIKSSTPWFSAESTENILGNNTVEERGDFLLSEVLYGYENQLLGLEKSSEEEADIQFIIDEVRINRAHFTINFPNPGPLYRIMMDVNILKDGLLVEKRTLSTKVNMSIVNFGHLPFKWMSNKEVKNSEYQLATFDAGLTKLYQKLYFDYFDISLYL